jgi:hypothetical protein
MLDGLSRFERSCMLIKASWDVLRADGELIVLPVLSGLASLVMIAVFGAIGAVAGAFGHLDNLNKGSDLPGWFYAGLFVFYLMQYFIISSSSTSTPRWSGRRSSGWGEEIRPSGPPWRWPTGGSGRSSATLSSPPQSDCCCCA